MILLFETLLGIFIVAAVLGLVCLVRALLPKTAGTPGVEAVTVIRAAGDAAGLEQAVRSLRYAPGQLIIADEGMTDDARARAELLSESAGAVLLRGDKITFKIEES